MFAKSKLVGLLAGVEHGRHLPGERAATHAERRELAADVERVRATTNAHREAVLGVERRAARRDRERAVGVLDNRALSRVGIDALTKLARTSPARATRRTREDDRRRRHRGRRRRRGDRGGTHRRRRKRCRRRRGCRRGRRRRGDDLGALRRGLGGCTSPRDNRGEQETGERESGGLHGHRWVAQDTRYFIGWRRQRVGERPSGTPVHVVPD